MNLILHSYDSIRKRGQIYFFQIQQFRNDCYVKVTSEILRFADIYINLYNGDISNERGTLQNTLLKPPLVFCTRWRHVCLAMVFADSQ